MIRPTAWQISSQVCVFFLRTLHAIVIVVEADQSHHMTNSRTGVRQSSPTIRDWTASALAQWDDCGARRASRGSPGR